MSDRGGSPDEAREADADGLGRALGDDHDDLDDLDIAWLRAKPGAKWSSVGADVLPAWVADMDFPAPAPVRAALTRFIAGADLGYPNWSGTSPLAGAFSDRMSRRFGWHPDPAHVREFTDIICGLQVVLHLVTEPDDAVAMHVPAYPPFLDALRRMRRRLVPIAMERGPTGWAFDPDEFADRARREGCGALILVNPHNPTGRVLTSAELTALAAVTVEHDLTVIADEVHADLVYDPHRHVPFASLGPEVAARTVTLTSATKAFNLAGIRCAVGHLGPAAVRDALAGQPRQLFGEVSVLGVEATLAAWRDGDGWLEEVRRRLDRNRRLLAADLTARLPELGVDPPEGTYLAWLDLRRLGLGVDPAAFLLDHARVQLMPGPVFGPGGEGFARLNFATSKTLLHELLDRVVAALRGHPGAGPG